VKAILILHILILFLLLQRLSFCMRYFHNVTHNDILFFLLFVQNFLLLMTIADCPLLGQPASGLIFMAIADAVRQRIKSIYSVISPSTSGLKLPPAG
jgi:hypothetical protein